MSCDDRNKGNLKKNLKKKRKKKTREEKKVSYRSSSVMAKDKNL